jgi:hypothetical protein
MDTILLTTVTRSEVAAKDEDDNGRTWGFIEYAELTIPPTTPIKDLHAFMQRLAPHLDWFKAKPIPMYRITRQRFQQAKVMAGVLVMQDDDLDELLEMWLKK